jgi:dipeptidyl aminopeptidase/acylaminoacyl peptidase
MRLSQGPQRTSYFPNQFTRQDLKLASRSIGNHFPAKWSNEKFPLTNKKLTDFKFTKVWHASETPRIIERELNFENGDATLSGTAYLPSEGRKVPGIVVLHAASGPSQSSKMYEHLCEGLPRIGIGVLVFDRRGTGKSTGGSRGNAYETLAYDAIAGQNALGKLRPIDPRRVGFWGISQGGWIALLATSRTKIPTFAIAVSAPLVTPERQMEFATSNLLRVRGYAKKDVIELINARKAWWAFLNRKISLAAATSVMQKVEKKPWFNLAFMPNSNQLESSRGALEELSYDPTITLEQIHVPLLFIYGADDPWVPVEESVKKLRAITRKRSNISYTVIPRANHEMMFRDQETMEFDEKVINQEGPEAPSYFMQMTIWLSKFVNK